MEFHKLWVDVDILEQKERAIERVVMFRLCFPLYWGTKPSIIHHRSTVQRNEWLRSVAGLFGRTFPLFP